jgi:hypothetical protein
MIFFPFHIVCSINVLIFNINLYILGETTIIRDEICNMDDSQDLYLNITVRLILMTLIIIPENR